MFMIELYSTTFNSWVPDIGCGTHICSNMHELRESRKLKHGKPNIIIRNRRTTVVIGIKDKTHAD